MHRIDLCMAYDRSMIACRYHMIPQCLLQFLALVHTGSKSAASPGVGVWVAVALPGPTGHDWPNPDV